MPKVIRTAAPIRPCQSQRPLNGRLPNIYVQKVNIRRTSVRTADLGHGLIEAEGLDHSSRAATPPERIATNVPRPVRAGQRHEQLGLSSQESLITPSGQGAHVLNFKADC